MKPKKSDITAAIMTDTETRDQKRRRLLRELAVGQEVVSTLIGQLNKLEDELDTPVLPPPPSPLLPETIPDQRLMPQNQTFLLGHPPAPSHVQAPYVPPFRPKRGDVVQYGQYLYFFQPNGQTCLLYHNSEDIGILSRVAVTPRGLSITRPDPARAAAFIKQDEARIASKPRAQPRPPPILPDFIDGSASDDSDWD